MPPTVNVSFKSWLKVNTNTKLSSDATVLRITYEGITNFKSLDDFDKSSIKSLPRIRKGKIPEIEEDVTGGITAEAEILVDNVSSISVRRLIVAAEASKYYTSIRREMNTVSMHYDKGLSGFKVEYKSYKDLKREDTPNAPSIQDKDGDKRVIKWAPIFKDALSKTYGSRGPLIYTLRSK